MRFSFLLCSIGWLWNIIREQSSYSRIVTDGEEVIDGKSIKECACGVTIETESHSNNMRRVTHSEESGLQAEVSTN